MDTQVKVFISVIGILILGVLATVIIRGTGPDEARAGEYDAFAQCLTDKGAVFYGAFWCPHCNSQKKMFGTSERLLPYVECSTPNGNAQTQACIDKGIESYPTWEFADGSRLQGEIPFATLAEKTGCVIKASPITAEIEVNEIAE